MSRPRSHKLPTMLDRALKDRKWTIKDLAEQAGVSEHTLGKNLQGHSMRLATALQILKALSFDMCTPDIMFLTQLAHPIEEE